MQAEDRKRVRAAFNENHLLCFLIQLKRQELEAMYGSSYKLSFSFLNFSNPFLSKKRGKDIIDLK